MSAARLWKRLQAERPEVTAAPGSKARYHAAVAALRVGLGLGRGNTLKQVLAGMSEVAEGVRNTLSVRELAHSVEVDMPITEQMFLVLYEDKPPREAVVDLMSRRVKHELA